MGSRRMSRKRRAQCRARAEREDHLRRLEREKGGRDPENRVGIEAPVCRAKVRHGKVTRRNIEELFENSREKKEFDPHNSLGVFNNSLQYNNCPQFRGRLKRLLVTLNDRAPGLFRPDFHESLIKISGLSWVRPVEEWKPRGKSKKIKVRSLIDHLIVRYPMPEFLYQLMGNGWDRYYGKKMFAVIAAGGKVKNCFKYGYVPIPMTRRMCHYFMESPSGTPFYAAVRNAQVRALGGKEKLARAISGTFLGRGANDHEHFWLTVIRWFCRRKEVESGQVGPLIDYIRHRREEDPGFSMKGRRVKALSRGMEAWHRELAYEKRIYGVRFTPSGYEEGIYELRNSDGNGAEKIIWAIEEIRSSKELKEEGEAMRHCVYYYTGLISSGECSIWSLRREGKRRLTVEVNSKSRHVVQARGKSNRQPKKRELSLLKRWARENNLKIKLWHLP